MPNVKTFTFNGITSTAMGISAVEYYPPLNRPRRKFTKLEIPGRTGDIVLFEDAWEDYEQDYEIYAGNGTVNSAPQRFNSIFAWLNSLGADGYGELVDDYDTGTYRMAYYVGPTDVDNVLNRFGRCTIKFMCQGKRWLMDSLPVGFTASGGTISNPTKFASLPTIYVEGTGDATLTIGGTTVTLLDIPENLTIDCERMVVLDDNEQNANGHMALGNFPTIPPGMSTVTWTGSITSVAIEPRYFTI